MVTLVPKTNYPVSSTANHKSLSHRYAHKTE